MRSTKIIYGDGVVERLACEDTAQALEYARDQARARGTFVRAQSCLIDNNERRATS